MCVEQFYARALLESLKEKDAQNNVATAAQPAPVLSDETRERYPRLSKILWNISRCFEMTVES